MLKNVKAMILEKKEYLEAAQIIFEDATGSNIDDLIILGESADLPEDQEEEKEDDIPGGKDDDDIEDENGSKEDDSDDDDGDLDNLPLDDDEPEEGGAKGSEEGDDLLDNSIEDEMQGTLSDTDDLPALAGKQTGEPIADNIDDFLNVTIDLKSNTLTDILPIPPANANEAIADDVLSTRVDAGFGESVNSALDKISTKDRESIEKKVNKIIDGLKVIWNKLINMAIRATRALQKKLSKNPKESYIVESILTIKEIRDIYTSLSNPSNSECPVDYTHFGYNKIETMLNRKNTIKISITENDMEMLGKALDHVITFNKDFNDRFKDVDHDYVVSWKASLIKISKVLSDIIAEVNKQLAADKPASGSKEEPIKEGADAAAAAAGFPMEEEKEVKEKDLKENAFDINFMEAISLGGDAPAEGDEAAADGGTPPVDENGDEVPADGAESEVTAAVKDKVAEADTPVDAAGTQSGKEDLLKKLGNITKSLEDAKKAVMNTIQ